jgi:hypothetical protein
MAEYAASFSRIEKKLQDPVNIRHITPTITRTYTGHIHSLGFVKPKNLA